MQTEGVGEELLAIQGSHLRNGVGSRTHEPAVSTLRKNHFPGLYNAGRRNVSQFETYTDEGLAIELLTIMP